ncbi:MAG: hypothetical protein LUK37_05540 [Clostridia bacterium]|nr:hypothetical protein [Clostridia bacterium]
MKKNIKGMDIKRVDIKRKFRPGIMAAVPQVLLSIMAAKPVCAGKFMSVSGCRMKIGGGDRMTMEVILKIAGSGWMANRTANRTADRTTNWTANSTVWHNIVNLARTDIGFQIPLRRMDSRLMKMESGYWMR